VVARIAVVIIIIIIIIIGYGSVANVGIAVAAIFAIVILGFHQWLYNSSYNSLAAQGTSLEG
jgi:hypothetical protein